MNNYFYYFFSTVPQVLGAVLALFGVFVVFKVQTIKDDLLGLAQSIRNKASIYCFGVPPIEGDKVKLALEFLQSIEELIERHGIDTLVKKFAEMNQDPIYNSQIKAYSANYEVLKRLIRKTIKWASITAFTIFLCILALAFANYILPNCNIRIILFGLIILCTIIIFCWLIEILSEALSDHTFRYLVKNYIKKASRRIN